MRAIGHFFGRILFWSYDRGTLPYDFLVLAIVLFVFLSPRRWFHDQPETGQLSQASAVHCQEGEPPTGQLHCRVEAQLLTPPQRSLELQRKAHEVLSANAAQLTGRTFEIVQIQPVVGEDGSLLYYVVSVKP